MDCIIKNSVNAWKSRVQLEWTPLRRIQEMARHFRVGSVMTKLSQAGGLYRWTMWFESMYKKEPEDLRGTAVGEVCKDTKNDAAEELARVLEEELGFGGEARPITARDVEQDPEGILLERIAVDGRVDIICDVCSEFVHEPLYLEHLVICSRRRHEGILERVELAETIVTRLSLSVASCCICLEEAADLNERNYLGLISCGHLICELCYRRVEMDATSRRKNCPSCRQSIRHTPTRIIL